MDSRRVIRDYNRNAAHQGNAEARCIAIGVSVSVRKGTVQHPGWAAWGKGKKGVRSGAEA